MPLKGFRIKERAPKRSLPEAFLLTYLEPAVFTMALNAFGSRTAKSANTLRLMRMSATFMLWINLL